MPTMIMEPMHRGPPPPMIRNLINSIFSGGRQMEMPQPIQHMKPLIFTFTSHGPPRGLPIHLGGGGGGGIFGGLLANMGRMMRVISRRSELGQEQEQEEEEEAPEKKDVVEEMRFKQEQMDADETKLEEEVQELKSEVDALETLKHSTDDLMTHASWRVNAAYLKASCMNAWQGVCSDSIPQVFYLNDGIPRHPRGPHSGLAPVKEGGPCWMECMKNHPNEVPFQCSVAATRMKSWIESNGNVKEFDPRMVMVGALVHFLVLVLLISACIRCTYICLSIRRRRRQELIKDTNTGSSLPTVAAITIQIPQVERTVDATVVTGTEVKM